ncbi:MAG TPA: flagellar basal body P-ring formation chaperone FlgA [Cellvibrionaceae bacterium]|nr:flagellar basal body P-ring formation chaperone FlgA [Cellvibrionaceae bacterium]HMW72572.1 flagellar basal body P-ring formation chaperone FlgA [Cellvibrionaceae bacterium]HNG58594.1 flagellar basal body P-ring formation chaperone FlgA [Cellvibrionaceae bacterium]
MSTCGFARAGLTAFFCLFIHTIAQAQDLFEEIEPLRNKAQQLLISQLQPTAGTATRDIEVKMLPLDPRLRLSRCDVPVDYQINSPVATATSATVKISCSGTVHWSLYAPAQIAVFGETAVASHSLERGSLIQPGDFHFVRQNLSQIGANYVDPTAVIVGQELKRSMREGEPLRLSYLELPKIVQRGDRVTLEAQALGLNVAAPGLAMANGKVGERIQVKNAQSNKIVDALVIAPGRVRVKYE